MSLTGLQNQYTGYSINLTDARITLLAMEFISSSRLIDIETKHLGQIQLPMST